MPIPTASSPEQAAPKRFEIPPTEGHVPTCPYKTINHPQLKLRQWVSDLGHQTFLHRELGRDVFSNLGELATVFHLFNDLRLYFPEPYGRIFS